jgi:micrococcal nuclease
VTRYEYAATVRSIYDADTLRADVDLGFNVWRRNEPLRLLGIDAPEMTTPAGKAARAHLLTLIAIGDPITVHTVKDAGDKYGRLLAVIWPGTTPAGLSINQLLIDAGHAKAYSGGPR